MVADRSIGNHVSAPEVGQVNTTGVIPNPDIVRVAGYVVQYPVLYLHFPSILTVPLAITFTEEVKIFGLAEYQLSRRSDDSEFEYIELSRSCFPQ